MDEEKTEEQRLEEGLEAGRTLNKSYTRNVSNRSFAFQRGDFELIKWGAEFLGCSQSEFVRTACRAFATSLEKIEKSRARL